MDYLLQVEVVIHFLLAKHHAIDLFEVTTFLSFATVVISFLFVYDYAKMKG